MLWITFDKYSTKGVCRVCTLRWPTCRPCRPCAWGGPPTPAAGAPAQPPHFRSNASWHFRLYPYPPFGRLSVRYHPSAQDEILQVRINSTNSNNAHRANNMLWYDCHTPPGPPSRPPTNTKHLSCEFSLHCPFALVIEVRISWYIRAQYDGLFQLNL